MRHAWVRFRATALVLASALLLAGCGDEGASSNAIGGDAVAADERPAGARPRSESAYILSSGSQGTGFAAGCYELETTSDDRAASRGIFLARYDASGEPIWKRRLACSEVVAIASLAVGEDDSTWLTGWYSGHLQAGDACPFPSLSARGLSEMFLVAYAPDGQCRWALTTATTGAHPYATGELVVPSTAGAVLVAGNVHGCSTFGPSDMEVAGTAAHGAEHGYIARYEASGRLAWRRSLAGCVDAQRGAVVASAPDGGALVAGTLRRRGAAAGQLAGPGLFVGRFDRDGRDLWTGSVQAWGSVAPKVAAITSDGSVVVAGWYMGTAHFGAGDARRTVGARGMMDLFVACYEPSGRMRWLRTAGGQGEAYAEVTALEPRDDGGIDVAGTFGGTIEFLEAGGTRVGMTAQGEVDKFRARLDAQGRLDDAGRCGDPLLPHPAHSD